MDLGKFKLPLSDQQLLIIGEIAMLANFLEASVAQVTDVDFYTSNSHSPVDPGIDRGNLFKAFNLKLRDFEKHSRLHQLTNWQNLSGSMKEILDRRDTILHGEFDSTNSQKQYFVNRKDGTSVSAEVQDLESLKDLFIEKINLMKVISELISRHDLDMGKWAQEITKQKRKRYV